MSENQMSPLLLILAAADAALTAFERINAIVAARASEVGELTPEEDAALEAYEERRFASWNSGGPVSPD
jgi:hypothetical protein